MHLHPFDFEMRKFGGRRVGGGTRLQGHAELVLALAGRDLGMRLRIDVRVYPDADRRLAAELPGHVVDACELRLALRMEGEDARLQREPDFRLGLAHAGENASVDLRARRQHTAQLATADKIKGRPEVRQQSQQREIAVRLERKAHLHVQAVKTGGKTPVVVLHRGSAVNVGRRAVQMRD